MLIILAMSVVLAILSLAGIIWDVLTGLLTNGVDGILLLLTCLMLGGLFSLMAWMTAADMGLVPAISFGKKAVKSGAKPAVPAPAAKPAAAPATPAPPAPAAEPPASEPPKQA